MRFPASMFALLLAAAAAPCWGQYKVVGADGRVTYTDRPPPAQPDAKVTALGRSGAAPAPTPESTLPYELRQVVARFPVTLYTTADCAFCDNARRLLVQRGIPYAEKRIASEEDSSALERLIGGRAVPALTIGAQPLRGFSPSDWTSLLDAAGYPRESRLPRSWQTPAPTPLVARAAPAPASAPAAPPPAAAPQPQVVSDISPSSPEPPPSPTPGVRF